MFIWFEKTFYVFTNNYKICHLVCAFVRQIVRTSKSCFHPFWYESLKIGNAIKTRLHFCNYLWKQEVRIENIFLNQWVLIIGHEFWQIDCYNSYSSNSYLIIHSQTHMEMWKMFSYLVSSLFVWDWVHVHLCTPIFKSGLTIRLPIF